MDEHDHGYTVSTIYKLLKDEASKSVNHEAEETTVSQLLSTYRALYQQYNENFGTLRNLDRKINYYVGNYLRVQQKRKSLKKRASKGYSLGSSSSSNTSPHGENPPSPSQIPNHNALLEEEDPYETFLVNYFDTSEIENIDPLYKRREIYESLITCIRKDPMLLIKAVKEYVKFQDLDAYTSMVVFSLYGNLFQKGEEQSLLYFIKSVLQYEYETYKLSAINFMRSNTFGTKLLTAYTKRGSKEFLYHALREPLSRIFKESPDLEIDPLKLYKVVVKDIDKNIRTREQMSEVEEVKIAHQQNAAKLTQFCQLVIDNLFQNVHIIPHGIRWICNQIYNVGNIKKANQEDQEVLTEQDKIILVGSFFFLRFFVPAIIAPEKNIPKTTSDNDSTQFLNSPITPHHRGCLTSISRIVERVSNGTLYTSKEWYNEIMNPFLIQCAAPLASFTHKLIDVGDEVDYSCGADANQGVGKLISISPNELYLLQGLIFDHVEDMVPEGHPLRDIAEKLGPPPPPLDPKANKMLILEITDDSRNSLRMERLSSSEIAGLEQLMVELEPENFDPQYDSDIIASLSNLRNVDNTLIERAKEVLNKLQGISSSTILSHVARQYNKRVTYRASLIKDKEDLTGLIHKLQAEVSMIADRIATYTVYLNNTKKFRFERGDKDTSLRCGFACKDLMDLQVVNGGNNINNIALQDVFFVFELQAPGKIQMSLHSEPVPLPRSNSSTARRLFMSERTSNTDILGKKTLLIKQMLDLDALLDEILFSTEVEMCGVNFNLKNLLSLMSKHLM
jgi:hypothetical protein